MDLEIGITNNENLKNCITVRKMNNVTKKHMDVLWEELRNWTAESFPEHERKEELLELLRENEKIEEDAYEYMFEELMDIGEKIFNPAAAILISLQYMLHPKREEIMTSFRYFHDAWNQRQTKGNQ